MITRFILVFLSWVLFLGTIWLVSINVLEKHVKPNETPEVIIDSHSKPFDFTGPLQAAIPLQTTIPLHPGSVQEYIFPINETPYITVSETQIIETMMGTTNIPNELRQEIYTYISNITENIIYLPTTTSMVYSPTTYLSRQ